MTNEIRNLTDGLAKELSEEIIDENLLLFELQTLLKESLILKDLTRKDKELNLSFYNGQKFAVSIKSI